MPCSYANTTARTRSRSPSLRRMEPTWLLTVASVTTSRAAISVFERPWATSTSTSRSRGVSSASTASGGAIGSVRAAKSSISRRVIDGDSSASPSCTTRIASTSGARSQRAEDVFVEVECREHEHSGRRLDCAARQLRCRLDSIHVGHADVHQDDVGSQLAHAVDRLPAVGSLADDLEPGLRVEEQPEAGAHEL